MGQDMIRALNQRLVVAKLDEFMQFVGEPWWPRIALANLPAESSVVNALVRQEFTAQGLLIASGLNFCLAHDEKTIINRTLVQSEKAFEQLSKALHSARPEQFLGGKVAVSDFDVRGNMLKDAP